MGGQEEGVGDRSSPPDPATEGTSGRKGLDRFLLAEYNNLAQAHFKMVDTISEFFKHYLTVVSIPTAAIAIVLNVPAGYRTVIGLSTANAVALSALLVAVALVGSMLLWYVINLRMDALLYARAINGIRKHFYDHDTVTSVPDKLLMRALPQSPQVPNYREFRYFGSVVMVFALLNSFYFLLGMGALAVAFGWVGGRTLPTQPMADWRALLGTGAFFAAHLAGYRTLARYRETGYLKSNIIGVDIDGVVNKHREHFAAVLKEKTGKSIDPEKITAIPVRKVPGFGVSRDDEILVFNTPDYWTQMPAAEGASIVLGRLRRAFDMRVHVFTSRPWPSLPPEDPNARVSIKQQWADAVTTYSLPRSSGLRQLSEVFRWRSVALTTALWRLLPERLGPAVARLMWDPMSVITMRWLRENAFSYNRLVIERAGEDVSDPRARFNNRFHEARAKQMRFFVEDDYQKARKLAYACEVVFLVDQPYSQDVDLPGNVIRVASWDVIYDRIKELA